MKLIFQFLQRFMPGSGPWRWPLGMTWASSARLAETLSQVSAGENMRQVRDDIQKCFWLARLYELGKSDGTFESSVCCASCGYSDWSTQMQAALWLVTEQAQLTLDLEVAPETCCFCHNSAFSCRAWCVWWEGGAVQSDQGRRGALRLHSRQRSHCSGAENHPDPCQT